MRRLLLTSLVIAVCVLSLWAADKAGKDTPAAAATRKKLKLKVTVEYKDEHLSVVAAEEAKELLKKLNK